MGYQPPVAVWDKLDAYLQTLLREDITVSGYRSAEMRAQVRATALAALAQRGELQAANLQRYQPQLPPMSLLGDALYAPASANHDGGGEAPVGTPRCGARACPYKENLV